MAKVSSRVELIEYCLRKLGFPVIEINIDDDQIQDRIDDTLDFYYDYHMDATERTFFSVELTQTDIDNGYITVPDNLIFVTRALPLGRNGSAFYPMGDPNAAYDYHRMFDRAITRGDQTTSHSDSAGVTSDLMLTTYYLNMQYYEQIQSMFGAGDEVPIRFNRHTNRVYLDMDWSQSGVSVGSFIMLEGRQTLDPEVYNDVYNDRWVKRYATAQIKKQWGANLIKYSGITLAGGVTLDGDKLFNDANEEIDRLEDEMQEKYEEPPSIFMG